MLIVCAFEYKGILNVKHFCRYVVAKYNLKQEEMVYKVYMSDLIKMIAENTARAVKDGKYTEKKWFDIINKNEEVEETRSAQEIIEYMKNVVKGCG